MDELSLTRFKVCTKCGCTKPVTREFFHIASKSPFRWRANCITCRLINRKAWYDANREIAIQRVVECAKKNPNRKAYMAEYYPRWRAANPHYERDRWRRKQREATPEEIERERLRCREKENRRRAIKRLTGSEHVDPQIIEQMYDDQGGLCAYCETVLFGTYHLDHMQPLSRGGAHDWSNFAITCPRCNIRKHARTAEEFWIVLST